MPGLSQGARLQLQEELPSRLQLVSSSSFIPPVPQQRMGNMKGPSRTGFLVVWAAGRALCSAQVGIPPACESVYVPRSLASGFEEKHRRGGVALKAETPMRKENPAPSAPSVPRLDRSIEGPACSAALVSHRSDQGCGISEKAQTVSVSAAFKVNLRCSKERKTNQAAAICSFPPSPHL